MDCKRIVFVEPAYVSVTDSLVARFSADLIIESNPLGRVAPDVRAFSITVTKSAVDWEGWAANLIVTLAELLLIEAMVPVKVVTLTPFVAFWI